MVQKRSRYVLKILGHMHWRELRKNQYDKNETFLTSPNDLMSMKYKQYIYMRFDGLWSFPS